ncbi:unnamed protein product, partial [Nesidiocoris tenuis]
MQTFLVIRRMVSGFHLRPGIGGFHVGGCHNHSDVADQRSPRPVVFGLAVPRRLGPAGLPHTGNSKMGRHTGHFVHDDPPIAQENQRYPRRSKRLQGENDDSKIVIPRPLVHQHGSKHPGRRRLRDDGLRLSQARHGTVQTLWQ